MVDFEDFVSMEMEESRESLVVGSMRCLDSRVVVRHLEVRFTYLNPSLLTLSNITKRIK